MKSPQTMPLRRKASSSSLSSSASSSSLSLPSSSTRDGKLVVSSAPRRFYRRFYCGSVLLLIYCTCMYTYSDWGMTRSLSTSPMLRKTASDYTTQQLPHLDQSPRQPLLQNSKRTRVKNDSVVIETTIETALGALHQPQAPTQAPSSTKPRLVLHVGPQKTGSSTLQSMLDKLSGLTGTLEGDNYSVRHIRPEAGDFDCELDDWGGWHNCKASSSLIQLIQTARNQNQNLLLTDENLNQDFAAGLREAIDDNDWDVTVVVMYRRIHEWLVSWYNQINKTTNLGSDGKVLFDEDGNPYRTLHQHWPDRGGVHVPSFSSWYETYTQTWQASQLASKHRSIEYYHLYQEYFPKVLLYNMHQEQSMVSEFVCNILGATHACDRLLHGEMEIEKINGSVHLEHDILAVYAYEKGLFSPLLSRRDVVQAVTNYLQESGKTLPRICHPELTNQLRTWFVETEKIMVGESNWSDARETEAVTLYDSFVAKGTLCDVDQDAVLADEDWLTFFQSLEQYEKRNLVVQVGPIGGDILHDALTTLSEEDEALQKDNYTLIEMDNPGEYFDCTQEVCKASAKLHSAVSSLEARGENVILSNDEFDERFVQAFKESFDERKWNIKIVVGHARLNQLLLTMYREKYRSKNVELKDSSNQWPDQGGSSIPTFNLWFNEFAKGTVSEHIAELLGVHLRDAFSSSFQTVDYFAFHPQKESLVTDFVCQILPRATHSCQLLKAELSSSSKKEKEPLLDDFVEADSLAIRAHETGRVPTQVSRKNLRDAIQAKLKDTKKVLKRICVSSATKQLYDWMVESEKAMMGDRFTSKRIAWINQDFQELLESGKLCALDVETELNDQMWETFFQNYQSVVARNNNKQSGNNRK